MTEFRVGQRVRYKSDGEVVEVVELTDSGRVVVRTSEWGLCTEDPTDLEDAVYASGALRDQFAIAALQGLCAYSGSYGGNNGPGELSARAYEVADAMLEARK